MLRDGRDPIQRPSWGIVLSAIDPEANDEAEVLWAVLVGLDSEVRVLAMAK